MKKLPLLLLLYFVSVAAQAQSLKIGIKSGITLGNVSGRDAPEGNRIRVSGHGGPMALWSFSDLVGLQTEVLLSNKGYKVKLEQDMNGVRSDETVNGDFLYVDVPVLFRFRSGKLFFDLGPQAGYLLRADVHQIRKIRNENGGMVGQDLDNHEKDEDKFTRLDIGLATGLGLQTANGWNFGLRYYRSFRSLNNTSISDQQEVFHSGFQASVGLYFGYKEKASTAE
ncbi:MAG: PorT family protein [Hymenobacteraceae bacterium]|nr:PorT family protein [Hymenobacteraceae bacterium]MDX5395013.1 PorT family protein [Hymenobacteraceae bacterium]MDX5444166.1 PorT family protein [Hymenobacteraceae bacterium]MDX5511045.1 PorT family protein [Hymenobacteraceae bacterium]